MRSVYDQINLLNSNLNLSANDYMLALLDPDIAIASQVVDTVITIIVTANPTSLQITGSFQIDVKLIR